VKIDGLHSGSFFCLFKGVRTRDGEKEMLKREAVMDSSEKILCVCTGNICRSPMAEEALKNFLPGSQISSAGINAMDGHDADPTALRVMSEKGYDLSRHVGQQISDEMVLGNTLILVMTVAQRNHIIKQWPSARGKVFLLGHWNQQEISDPYMQGDEIFEITRDLILQNCELWTQKLTGKKPESVSASV